MFERFTDQSRRAVVMAQEEARHQGHAWIGPEHVFIALFRRPGSEAGQALAGTGVSIDQVRLAVVDVVGQDAARVTDGHIPFTAEAKECLSLALRATLDSGSNEVRTSHLLQGVLEKPGPVLERVLADLGIDRQALEADVTRIGRDQPESAEGPVEVGTYEVSSDMPMGRRRMPWFGPTGGRMMGGAIGSRLSMALVACGFCGRPAPQSGVLVSGPAGAAICQSCAEAALELLGAPREVADGDDAPRLWLFDPTVRRAIPGLSAAEAAEATEQIRTVFAAMNDRSDDGADAVSVEDGEGLGVCIGQAHERHPQVEPAQFPVHDVEFQTPTRAQVSFSVIVFQGPVVGQIGEAVRVDGAWKVARSTLTNLMAMAGVQCPPARPAPPED